MQGNNNNYILHNTLVLTSSSTLQKLVRIYSASPCEKKMFALYEL